MAKWGFIALALIKRFDRIELDPVQLGRDNIEFEVSRWIHWNVTRACQSLQSICGTNNARGG